MQTLSLAFSSSRSELLSIALAAMVGLGLIFVVGHVQASSLHEAAHDVRHATGFPCH